MLYIFQTCYQIFPNINLLLINFVGYSRFLHTSRPLQTSSEPSNRVSPNPFRKFPTWLRKTRTHARTDARRSGGGRATGRFSPDRSPNHFPGQSLHNRSALLTGDHLRDPTTSLQLLPVRYRQRQQTKGGPCYLTNKPLSEYCLKRAPD